MSQTSQKNLVPIIVVVIVLAVFSWIFYTMSYKPNTNSNSENQAITNQPSRTNKNSTASTNTGSSNATAPVKLPYGEAINVYAGKIIQFDPTCAAKPSYQVFKKGTVIMLDNRSSSDKKITLDSASYTIKAYDYALVTLTTKSQLPHTILVDCDGRQNVASINIQQ